MTNLLPTTVLTRLTSLVSASFFVNLSNAAITTMIGITIAQRGGDQSDVSLIAACYSIGYLAGCVLSPRFISRFGYIRAFTASAAILTISIVALDIFFAVTVWAVLRFTMGAAVAAVTAIADAWINNRTPGDMRGRVIALYSIVLGLAAVISQGIFVFADAGQEDLVLGFAIAMNLAVVLVALTSATPPEITSSSGASLFKLTSVSASANVAAFSTGFVRASILAIVPFYLAEHDVEAGLIAANVAVFYLGRLLFQWPIGVLSDRIDRRSLIAILSVIVAAVVAIAALPGGFEGKYLVGDEGLVMQAYAFLLTLLLGGAVFPLYSVAAGLAYGRAGDEPLIEVSKTLLILNSIGAVVGPMFIVFVAPFFGDRALHLCVFAVAATTIVVALTRRGTTEPPEDKITDVVAGPETSIDMAGAAAEASVDDQR
ncbi:MAG: MFS transporter [Woeseiaceae bacterium]